MTIGKWKAFWLRVQPTLEALDEATNNNPHDEVRRRLALVEERLSLLEQGCPQPTSHG